MTGQLKWVATVKPVGSGGSRIIGQDESVDLHGGEEFVSFTRSEAQNILGHPIIIGEDGKPDFSENDIHVISEYRKLDKSLSGMSARNQRRYLKKLKKESHRATINHEKEIAECEKKLRVLHNIETAFDELRPWSHGTLTLQKPSGTMFHKLIAAEQAHELLVFDPATRDTGQKASSGAFEDAFGDASVFVIEHDWASAFRNAKDYVGGEYRLPDETCAFEFRISDKHVIALAFELDGYLWMQPIMLMSHGWVIPFYSYRLEGDKWRPHQVSAAMEEDDWLVHLVDLIGQQIRAVAIALDASVARSTVVQPDRKLNRARERRGNLPIYEYHIVSLANRQRHHPVPVVPGDHDYQSRALHFVRPHRRNVDRSEEASLACEAGGDHSWPPYDKESRSTCSKCGARSRRIEWHLRGDPDLGFIDKHYRL